MDNLQTITKSNPQLAQEIQKNYGFITESQISELEAIDRFMLVMVRCNNGRFVCPIQDLKHFKQIIQEHYRFLQEKSQEPGWMHGGDWVRDVSVLHNVLTEN